MAIAWASWRFVEIPFRSSIRPRAATIAASAAGLAISSICGADMLAAKFSHTDPANLAALTRYGEKYDNSQYFRSSSCFIFSKSTTKLNKDKCLSKSATKKNYLIVGDSHAAHLWYGLSTVYSDFNWMQATASGCLPDPKPVGAERCTKVMNFVFNEYLVHNPVDLLVVAARWEGRLDEVSRIIEWAKSHGVPLLIVGPTIEYDAELPTLVIDSARLGNSSLIAAHLRPNQRERDAEMQTFVTNKGVPYVSMQSLLCDSKDCRSRVDGGIPMQFDYGHLTAEGSIYVATEMKAKNLLP